MQVRELAVPDAHHLLPRQHGDDRGVFLEWFRQEALAEAVGHPLRLAQANCSVSRRGALRGIHYADVPPGQAKVVTCMRGTVLDVVVDLRVGSPAFGHWDTVRLDDVDHGVLYLAEGLGHAFLAMTDDATVAYLCTEAYNPAREHRITPLDPDLAVAWPPDAELLLSHDDAQAPTLAEVLRAGALPRYEDCLALYASLAASAPAP
jgi:dTDP-4-dehydrorhamnose 3,5-epimerase